MCIRDRQETMCEHIHDYYFNGRLNFPDVRVLQILVLGISKEHKLLHFQRLIAFVSSVLLQQSAAYNAKFL